MSRICAICGKGPVAGRSLSYRGMAKMKGGVGKKLTGKVKRRFLPNLRSVKAVIKGSPKRVKVCAQCLKGGKVTKAA